MSTANRTEITTYVTNCYEASRNDLNMLLTNMQPLQSADTEAVNAQIKKVHENILALRYAAVLCLQPNKGAITVVAEPIFTLNCKQEWLNKVVSGFPKKTIVAEQWLWLDANGNAAAIGEDFSAAQKQKTYPITVYRLQRIAHAHQEVD